MKLYVGVTDLDWFNFLREREFQEVNFWKPGGNQPFAALQDYELFLFKLHSPNNFIVGGGFYINFQFLPISVAWNFFGEANGTANLQQLRDRRNHYYRGKDNNPDPLIGCITLTSPFYFEQIDWIPVPSNWKPNIVQGRGYSTDDQDGTYLYENIMTKLRRTGIGMPVVSEGERFGLGQIIRPRIGQAAFKSLITQAYQKRCAITGEKTLPVLQAAHIRPFSQNGPHDIKNGLLLRQDVHTLFDLGFITLDEKLNVIVSNRIKEEYGNGKEYYAFHGKPLAIRPANHIDLPSTDFVVWHQNNVYLG